MSKTDKVCAVCGLREVVAPDKFLLLQLHLSCAESLAANIPLPASRRLRQAISRGGAHG